MGNTLVSLAYVPKLNKVFKIRGIFIHYGCLVELACEEFIEWYFTFHSPVNSLMKIMLHYSVIAKPDFMFRKKIELVSFIIEEWFDIFKHKKQVDKVFNDYTIQRCLQEIMEQRNQLAHLNVDLNKTSFDGKEIYLIKNTNFDNRNELMLFNEELAEDYINMCLAVIKSLKLLEEKKIWDEHTKQQKKDFVDKMHSRYQQSIVRLLLSSRSSVRIASESPILVSLSRN